MPGRLGNPSPGARSHLHYTHAPVEIVRQRLANLLEFLRILGRQHRQPDTSRQHSRRILLLQKQYRRCTHRTRNQRLLPAFHVSPRKNNLLCERLYFFVPRGGPMFKHREPSVILLARVFFLTLTALALATFTFPLAMSAQTKPRARNLGVPFDRNPGRNNAITDEKDVEVAHTPPTSAARKLEPRH